jgi:hypothetical protein
MSTLETKKIEPLSGTSVTLGAAGDAVTMPAGVTVKTNTVKDAGGNTLWTSDGSGTLSSVNSGLTGGMIFISSATASGSASVEFTSGIDSTYDEYVFYLVDINPSASNPDFGWISSSDGGSSYGIATTTTMFRADHKEDNSAAGLSYRDGRDAAQSTGNITLTGNVGNDADNALVAEFHLYSPSNTSKVKHFTAVAHSMQTGGGYFYQWHSAGYINTTSAINAIKWFDSSGNFDGNIYLYGIK